MKEVTTNPCQVCKCKRYKVISQEKFAQAIRCLDCGSEYSRVTDSDQLKIHKLVERKIKTGEIDDRIDHRGEVKKVDKRLEKSHKKFLDKILK